jgi:integrase
MRVGELCTLTPDSIVRRDRRTFLKVTGKGDNDRLAPLTPGLVPRIERYMLSTAGHQQPVSLRGSPASASRRLRGADQVGCAPAGQGRGRARIKKRVHPHLFRQLFATEALRTR